MSLTLILDERKRRAALVAEAGKILSTAATAGRPMTAEESEKWQKMHDDAEGIRTTVERMEAQRNAEASLALVDPAGRDTALADPRELPAAHRAAQRARVLRSWLQGPKACAALSSEDQHAAKRMGIDLGGTELTLRGFMPTQLRSHKRLADLSERAQAGLLTDQEQAMFRTPGELRADMTTATDPAAIPTGFVSAVEVAMIAEGGMREVSQVIRTATGNDLPFPTVNDTGNTGELVAEAVAVAELAAAISSLTIEAFTYSSKMIPLSLELLQDEAVNIESLVGGLAGQRIARILNTHLTTGDGAAKPKGVVTAATLGKTFAAVAAVTYLELLDLKHSVTGPYRRNARWMFKDSTLLALKKLVDSQNRPLWAAGIGEGSPDLLDGDPYTTNEDMAALATGNKTILYGDFSKYLLRDVLDVQLVVLRERYAEKRVVGMFAFSRHDGDLLDAGTRPIKYGQQA